MAGDKRVYDLNTAIAFLNQYIAIDKNGNTEAEKVPVSALYPPTYMRAASVPLIVGDQKVTFTSDFGVDDYVLINSYALDSEGSDIKATVGDQYTDGFDISAEYACTLRYVAIKI